ncbi:MAG TPA: Sec-independent protein translocase subunit TatA [Dermatophilaceae bacterium]|nr:Sec-independent protein translocase subunit TatA [Dermatophilaceae bacterium]
MFRQFGPGEILVLVLLLVIVLGWKKLPDAARSVGRSMRIFKSEVEQMRDDGKAKGSRDTVPGSIVDPRSQDAFSPAPSPPPQAQPVQPVQPAPPVQPAHPTQPAQPADRPPV